MPHPRLQIEIVTTAGTEFETELQQAVLGRPMLRDRVESLAREPVDEETEIVRLDVRFLTRDARQQVGQLIRDRLVNHAQRGTTIRAIRWTEHLCTHDHESPTPCDKSEFSVILSEGQDPTRPPDRESSRHVPLP